MNAEPQGSPPPDEAPSANRQVALVQSGPTPAREIRVVVDPVPMLDTARFEHMQRIATLMARTSMIPDSLAKSGTDLLPPDQIMANCFMVVNQAVRWNMDPFAVAQCASVIHGKLMWEGKLVAAVIDAKLGIRLKYTFVNDEPNRNPEDQRLGVVVSGQFNDEDEPRTIEGTVQRWHKGAKSPWANPADWKRQLRYMGAREWARAHAPAIMLGVIAEDEAEEAYHPQQAVPRHLALPTQPINTIALAEQAAAESIKHAAHAEARPEAIRGRRAPPPKRSVDVALRQGLDTVFKNRAGLITDLANCKTDNEVVAFQSRNTDSIMNLSDDDREAVVDEIQKARRLFGGT